MHSVRVRVRGTVLEIAQVKVLDHRINNAHRVVFRYILIRIKHKKHPVVVTVRFCM